MFPLLDHSPLASQKEVRDDEWPPCKGSRWSEWKAIKHQFVTLASSETNDLNKTFST